MAGFPILNYFINMNKYIIRKHNPGDLDNQSVGYTFKEVVNPCYGI